MALQKCGLSLTRELRELQPHGTLDFPCAGYCEVYRKEQGEIVPWHWHEEIEMLYVKEGALEIKIPSETFTAQTGDLCIINSNILHAATAVDSGTLQSIVCSPTLITGSEGSVFAKRYIQPLLACPSFSGQFIRRSTECEPARNFCSAFAAIENEVPGFEFIVRENVSRMMFFLVQLYEGKWKGESILQKQGNMRMRKMLEYIHRNYPENITLAEIARAADIGERECLRCFQKTIQLSPIQYVLKYRVMKGAESLLHAPESSISEIAFACGFDSPSNFAKMFKRFYGCSPREYRRGV